MIRALDTAPNPSVSDAPSAPAWDPADLELGGAGRRAHVLGGLVTLLDVKRVFVIVPKDIELPPISG